MRLTMHAGLTVAAVVLLGGTARAQASYKKAIPDSLAKEAKISEEAAATTARKRVPNGVIQAVELERENKKLIYSYELKVPGRSGVEEVNIDAVTGKLLTAEHESPAAEKAEQAKDRAKAPAKKP